MQPSRNYPIGECPSPGTATSMILEDSNLSHNIARSKPHFRPGLFRRVPVPGHSNVDDSGGFESFPQRSASKPHFCPELFRRVPVPGHSNVDISERLECSPEHSACNIFRLAQVLRAKTWPTPIRRTLMRL